MWEIMKNKFSPKLIISFLFVSTLLIGFQNCGKFNPSSLGQINLSSQGSNVPAGALPPLPGITPPPTAEQILLAKDVFRSTVYAVARKNCAGCHGVNQQPLFAQDNIDSSYEISKAGVGASNRKYADFANVPNSYFIEQAKNNHCRNSDLATARFCTGDGAEMLAAIKTWADFENKNLGGGGANIPPPVGGVAGVSKLIRLETRSYVATTLNEIFGPTSVPSTNAAIANDVINFGGACDSYSNNCGTNESQGAMIPAMTTPRAALVYRICDKILADDAAVEYARTLAGGASSATLPTTLNISGAYGLFYVGRVPPMTATTALQNIVNQSTALSYPAIEAWRGMFLALCHSQDWQIP